MQREIAYYKCPVCGKKNAFNVADAQEIEGRVLTPSPLNSREPGSCLCGFEFTQDRPEHFHRVTEDRKL